MFRVITYKQQELYEGTISHSTKTMADAMRQACIEYTLSGVVVVQIEGAETGHIYVSISQYGIVIRDDDTSRFYGMEFEKADKQEQECTLIRL